MRFTRAKQNRIFQDIVEQVQKDIVTGELAAGEKLPSERELCTIFSTSRGTLREALRILEQKKLLTIKLGAGGGAIVRKPNSELIAENLFLLVEGGEATKQQLLSMGADLAAQVAALAALKAGKNDVGPLKHLVAKLTDLMEARNDKSELLGTMDGLLFKELARIGGNPLYGFLLQATLGTTSRLHRGGRVIDEARQKHHYQEIRMIVYAVAQNDQKQSNILAQKHVLGLDHTND